MVTAFFSARKLCFLTFSSLLVRTTCWISCRLLMKHLTPYWMQKPHVMLALCAFHAVLPYETCAKAPIQCHSSRSDHACYLHASAWTAPRWCRALWLIAAGVFVAAGEEACRQDADPGEPAQGGGRIAPGARTAASRSGRPAPLPGRPPAHPHCHA